MNANIFQNNAFEGSAFQERRQVTLLFSDLSDSTAIASMMEPEHYGELLEALRTLIEQTMAIYGGDIVRIDGDGALCLFGYPQAFEDSGRRAAEAALDLHSKMQGLSASFPSVVQPLLLHTGVHSGLVLLRSGDMVRGKYEVLGDATNIAARLCDAAAPGQILVSVETLGRERHLFRCGEEQNLALSGHKKALPVVRLLERTAPQDRGVARAEGGLTPYVGRASEQMEFARWLENGSQVMLVHGPAGIGKTRFLRQITASAQSMGWQIKSGYCEEYLGARPMQPFLQIFTSITQTPYDDMAAHHGGLLQATLKAAEETPTLLFIDDWHWSDDASRGFLNDLLHQTDGTKLRVLIASRTSELDVASGTSVQKLELVPLKRDETLSTIEILLGLPDIFITDRIQAASGGSPLLVEELCLAFAGDEAPLETDPRGAWFDHAVQARFAKLGRQEAEFCRAAAVYGHIIPTWLLGKLFEGADVANLLNALSAAEFLFPGDQGDTIRFKHGLTRDAVYAAIGLSDRRLLHRRIFEALEQRSMIIGKAAVLDGLAQHSVASGDVEAGLTYAIAAGDAALSAGALDKAQAHYRVGLDLAGKLSPSSVRDDFIHRLMNKFGLACIVDPAPDQLAVFDRVNALLGSSISAHEQIRAFYWQGSILYGVGLGKQSVGHLSKGVALAQSIGDRRHIYLNKVKLAQSLSSSGQYDKAKPLFMEMLPEIRASNGRNDPEISAYALASFAFLHADQGEFACADTLFQDAREKLHDDGKAMNASFLSFQAASRLWQGRWDEAKHLIEQAFAVSERSRARHQNLMGHAKLAYVQWQQDQNPKAALRLEQSAAQFLASGNSHQRASMVIGWTIDVLADRGEREKARGFAWQMIQRIRVAGDRLGEAMAWRALARMELAAGAYDRADHYLGLAAIAATRRLSRREAAHNLLCKSKLLMAKGQHEDAGLMRTQAAAEFSSMFMPHFEAEANHPASR